jgi:hypothetical protein
VRLRPTSPHSRVGYRKMRSDDDLITAERVLACKGASVVELVDIGSTKESQDPMDAPGQYGEL